ncbi:MAG TPA: hypothetical protein DGT21_18165 [Armatimonadetes bacterium]|nr:hypothetical protein [Armatimonadota bacterium]
MRMGGLVRRAAAAACVVAAGLCLGAWAQPTQVPFEEHYLWLAGETVFMSPDGGTSWQEMVTGLPETARAIDIVALPDSGPRALLLTNDGLLRYEHFRGAWAPCALPARDRLRQLLCVWEPTARSFDDGRAYTGKGRAVYALGESYLWRTGDGGETWMYRDLPVAGVWRITGGCDGGREIVYLQSPGAVHMCIDMHGKWRQRDGGLPLDGHTSVMAAAIPNDPVRAYAVAGRQVYATQSGGQQWQLIHENDGTGWADPLDAWALGPLPGTLYLRWQVSNPMALPELSIGVEGKRWQAVGVDTIDLAADPFNDEGLFVVRCAEKTEIGTPGKSELLRARLSDPARWEAVGPVPGGSTLAVACRLPEGASTPVIMTAMHNE